MYKSLSPGAIGIRGLSLPETIELAQQTGFDGVGFSIQVKAARLTAEAMDRLWQAGGLG